MKFSVVIPVRNKRAHLQAAVQSVLTQTHSDFELIVVDDASEDGGVEELKAAIADERIKYLRRETPGPGGYAARNLGTKEATAQWVAFLDADDVWDSSFLALIVVALTEVPNAGFASTGIWLARSSGERSADWYTSHVSPTSVQAIGGREFIRLVSRGHWPCTTSSTVCNRELLMRVGGFPEGRCSRGGDRDTWIRLALKTVLARSPGMAATYFRDSDNMVTRTVPHPAEPCTVKTITEALDTPAVNADGDLRRQLKRLHNASHRSYLKQRVLSGEIDWGDFRRLYFFATPGYSSTIALAALLPKSVLRAMLGARRRQA